MKRKFIGSTIALILGIIFLVSSISQIAIGKARADPLVGEVMILGSLAYRSLKKRRLGIVKSTYYRKVFETLALILILALVILQRDFKMRLINDPLANFLIPFWAFIAYGIFFFKKNRNIIQDKVSDSK
jgi:hypothetical protein